MFRSVRTLSKPAAAESLNDLSPRPPMSNARPTLTSFLAGVPDPPDVPELLLPPQAAVLNATIATAAVASTFIPRDRRKMISFPKAPHRNPASGRPQSRGEPT